MLHPFDTDRGHSRTRKAAKKHATKSVAEGDAEASLQRHGHQTDVVFRLLAGFDLRRDQLCQGGRLRRTAQVKALPPGSYVSYGNTYQTQSEEIIAVIPVGYADGFRRAPTRWQAVLVRGQRASIVGRVCMDQTMINVSHIPNIRVGDEVVLIGRQGKDEISAEEVAGWLGTINYEVVSEILARVPRLV